MNEINFEINDIEEINLSMDVGVKEIYPSLEDLNVIPTKEQQSFKSQNHYGYNIVNIESIPDEYIIPDGTLEVAENGDIDVTTFKTARVGVYTPPTLQDKEVTPTKEIQTVVADENYDGLNNVTVKAIPDNYIEPTGTLKIIQNGTYNVENYAEAEVTTSGTGVNRIYLIKDGVEQVDITGGHTFGAISSDTSANQCSEVQKDGWIELSGKQWGAYGWLTNNSFDFTKYKKIYLDYEFPIASPDTSYYEFGQCKLLVMSGNNADNAVFSSDTLLSGKKTVLSRRTQGRIVNTNSTSEQCCVAVYNISASNNFANYPVRIYNFWIEE